MYKRTDELKPGDVIIVNGKPIVVEYVARDFDNIYIVRCSGWCGFFKADGLWLIEVPLDDVIKEVESLIGAE